MKTKHTPGPWNARGNTITGAAPPHHMHEYVVLGGTEDAWSDDETKIADARLMAASPDLLVAARRALNCLSIHSQYMVEAVALSSAIKKAEGND